EGAPPSLARVAGLDPGPRATRILAAKKSARLTHAERARIAAASPDVMFVSATTGEGVAALLARLSELLPESPFLYPEDEISTQSVRFFVGELVRETALEQLDEEVPY